MQDFLHPPYRISMEDEGGDEEIFCHKSCIKPWHKGRIASRNTYAWSSLRAETDPVQHVVVDAQG